MRKRLTNKKLSYKGLGLGAVGASSPLLPLVWVPYSSLEAKQDKCERVYGPFPWGVSGFFNIQNIKNNERCVLCSVSVGEMNI